MTKTIPLTPEVILKSSSVQFKDIPMNQYNKTLAEEKDNYSKEELVKIYTTMLMIRKFELLLQQVRTNQSYAGMAYQYKGPAHLSIGQEAATVGQAFELTVDDFIFGSHRSHGEIIAKSFSAIEQLSDTELLDVMENYLDGTILKALEKREQKFSTVKEQATMFIIYGLLAELFGKATGLTKGLGNSMHAFFAPFGSYPNNAIVGGSAAIAMGAALHKKVNKKPGIVIANLGDGSVARGPVWEAMNMASMDQFHKLWDEEYRGGLPIIFNFFNNLYAMGGQPVGETAGYEVLARIGAAINADQMHAERIDGFNPLAVIDAFRRKKKVLAEGKGPVLLDTMTYRFTGHSPSDPQGYRTKEEFDSWKAIDPIEHFKTQLVLEGIVSSDELKVQEEAIAQLLTTSYKLAIDEKISPFMSMQQGASVEHYMFSNERIEKMEDRACEVLLPLEENPRVKQIAKKIRVGIQEGKPVSKLKTLQVRDAIFESVIEKFYEDPTMIAYGEENRDWGGAYAVYNGLTESLPYHRLFNSPISEAAIIGSAVGYAMCGGRVVVELMYADFIGCAGDELFNQLAKWQAMSAGVLKMPVIVRVSVGSNYGAQHSQEWTSLMSHIPGLKVIYPVTPYDAKGLFNTILNGTDPVIVFENQGLYDMGEMFKLEGVPTSRYEIPLGEPDIKQAGSDLTILTIGATLYRAMEVATQLQEKYGVKAEVIDARSIVPFNYEKVVESVKKTGKIVLVSDATERNSILKEFAQTITELAFDYLDAPPVVIGARNWITPAAEYEKDFFPQVDWLLDAIHEQIMRLPNHTVIHNFTTQEKIRRNKYGV